MRFLEDDQHIHHFLSSVVHNSFLRDATHRVLLHNLRFWRYYFSTRQALPKTMVSHLPLLTALEQRDVVATRNAMYEHILTSRNLLNTLF